MDTIAMLGRVYSLLALEIVDGSALAYSQEAVALRGHRAGWLATVTSRACR